MGPGPGSDLGAQALLRPTAVGPGPGSDLGAQALLRPAGVGSGLGAQALLRPAGVGPGPGSDPISAAQWPEAAGTPALAIWVPVGDPVEEPVVGVVG